MTFSILSSYPKPVAFSAKTPQIRRGDTHKCPYANCMGVFLWQKEEMKRDGLRRGAFGASMCKAMGRGEPSIVPPPAVRVSWKRNARRGEVAGLKKQDYRDGKLYPVRSINSLGEETEGKSANAKRGFTVYDRLQRVLDDQAAMLKSLGIIRHGCFRRPQGAVVAPTAYMAIGIPTGRSMA